MGTREAPGRVEKTGLFLEAGGVLPGPAPPHVLGPPPPPESAPPEILKQKPTGPPRVGSPDLANENAECPITFPCELNDEFSFI